MYCAAKYYSTKPAPSLINSVVQNLCRIYAEFLLPCAASLRYFERGLLSFSATTAIATFASCVMLRLADLI